MQSSRRSLLGARGDGRQIADNDELLHYANLLNEKRIQCGAEIAWAVGEQERTSVAACVRDRGDAVDCALVPSHEVDLWQRPVQSLQLEAGERDRFGRRVTGAADALGADVERRQLSRDRIANLADRSDEDDVRDPAFAQRCERLGRNLGTSRIEQWKSVAK